MVRALVWVFISTQILFVMFKICSVGQVNLQGYCRFMEQNIGSFAVLDIIKLIEIVSISVALFILAKRSRQRQIEAIKRGDEKP